MGRVWAQCGVAFGLLGFLVSAGFGCSKAADPKASGKAEPKKLRIGLVTDAAGIDDGSFNMSAWEGLKKAKAEAQIETKYLESHEQADYKTNLSGLAEQGYDLVFAVGFLMEDALKEVAAAYPNTKFAIIDGSAPDSPNCVSLKFREQEGCFLAGYLAGRMSKSKAIGFVGGLESPLMKRFEVGYRAGAKTADIASRVVVKYVGNWTDVGKGKEVALASMRDGADILFVAAGKGGLGALDAVAERGAGFYGIGVDKDQDDLHKGRILTSMMKGVDAAVYGVSKDLAAGTWSGGERVVGIKEGGIKLSPMRFTKQDVAPAILAKLDSLSKAISDGKILVPTTEDEVQNFVPPKN